MEAESTSSQGPVGGASADRASVGGASLPGAVVRRGDAAYEPLRRASVWALNVPARRPDAIVQATSVDDVVAVVRHAAARDTTVAVKGSGHNYAATFLREGGIMLDVSRLDGARLLDDGVTAQVGPGIRSAELARFLNAHGRAFPGGHNATVGIGGFLLGGGMGFNGASWGEFACFEVEAVDVVTAAGELLTISADEHTELFWAARGAGAGFPAVAVGFRLRTWPLPAGMHASRWTYPLDAAREVAAWLQGHADRGGENVERYVAFEADEAGLDHPPVCHVAAIAFEREPAAARAALEELAVSAPAGALSALGPAPITYERLYAGGITGDVLRVVNETIWTDDPVDAAAALAAQVALAPDRRTVAMVDFRPAPRLPLDGAASVAARGFLSWGAKWSDSARDAENAAWVDATDAALTPWRRGRYLNESDVLRHPERARDCFSPAAWERIAAVRARYDPDGRFPSAY
ncbi:FAD-binding protein [Conexibacter stalactiti]|uniref:FAD-binding protein n=1 Tax=Conexibacter stalactiti TaxID=1940611 RepID=A0ABU4HUP1_9ACTN|nr:FAD-binding protein [Conexibacter stalactiti]MDW5596904.1 FAD-binding protein [Conexibacter stalactiti]MEC5037546.1 FAD-binding protein [Conexibacter stalactiti]